MVTAASQPVGVRPALIADVEPARADLPERITNLVLSRRVDESIQLGEGITITIQEIRGKRVAISLRCPESVRILRGEIPRTSEPPRAA